MTTTLPSYVTYTGKTSGSGAFSYDNHSRSITWTAGDITQGGTAQGIFQVSLLPSISQKGGPAQLTNSVSFSGYDRFAGVSVSATAVPVTTETKQEPGYILANGSVQ